MTTLADYLIIRDNPFEIGTGNLTQPSAFDFELPSDYVKGTNVAKPILQFIVRGILDDDYFFQIGFNDPQQLQSKSEVRYKFKDVSKSRIFTMHEAIDGSKLKPGKNRVYFRIIEGKVGFSDVVLWFQRKRN
ncbi:hypothetical protein [Parapedobacter tibetensis]|uniref:hypothetical protein n=1 Tax=Parapedobacter tibetensis TaxID=2972951 RepID=UPI00214D62B0|nr:hypothetical protein [Parapedobacter tibetensis]